MTQSKLQFIAFDTEIIYNFLLEKDKPVMEIELLRLFNQDRFLSSDSKKLYSLHFSLYHALYILKYSAGEKGYYLHLDPMRIRLIKVPESLCCHYDTDTGEYCGRDAQDSNFCDLHWEENVDSIGQLEFDFLRDFYLNEDNIAFGESELLNKLMNGIMVYAFKKDEISNALAFFDITDEPTQKNIQKKYYQLAKKYHPDKNNGNDNNMRLLNKSYQVLKEVYIL